MTKWISKKNQLPEAEEGNKILAFGNGYAFECEFEDGYWTNLGGEDFTHWMPLPEPPKQQGIDYVNYKTKV